MNDNMVSVKKVGGMSRMFSSTPFAVFVVTILITLAVHFTTGSFYSGYNLSMISRNVSIIVLVCFAQTIVLITGGIDLSVASIGSIASMLTATLIIKTNLPLVFAIILPLLAGVVCGFVNGFFIATFKLTPFIVTLATGEIFKGIGYVITEGTPIIGIPEYAAQIGAGMLFKYIPYVTIYMVIIWAILTFVLKYTTFGRHVFAVGGNRVAARIVGVRIKEVEVMTYSISGLLSAAAGILITLRLASYQASIGTNWVMPSVTAAVLGGTSMSGGSGGMTGTIIGALLATIISNCITLLSVSSYWETIVTGGVVLIAVLIDSIRRRKSTVS